MQLSATTTELSKNTSTTTNTSFDSTDVSDETVYQMLLKAFNDDTEKLTHYLNGSQKIQQQLQETQNTLQLFEQQILSNSVHLVNCCSEIQGLSSIRSSKSTTTTGSIRI